MRGWKRPTHTRCGEPVRWQVGLNHMAWYMHSLYDLKELYARIKEKQIPIERIADHGLSKRQEIHVPCVSDRLA